MTCRKQAEQTLQESEERFRVLSEASFEGIVFGENGILMDANKAFLDIYGYAYEEAIGKPIMSLVAPEHRAMVLQRIQSGDEGVYDYKGLHKSGRRIDLEVHGRNVIRQGRQIRMTAVRDISQRKQAETKLLAYQRQLKSLAHQLSVAEEQEKRRLAEQLHDDVGQSLALCKMNLQVTLGSISEPSVAKELENICEMLTCTMDSIRNITYELSSPLLKELGFEKALRAWLKDDIEGRHHINTELVVDGPILSMDENRKALLFRSIRELVTNSVKHANPNRIQVQITANEDTLSVCVVDDGIGFAPEALALSSRKTFGLFSIRERLEYFGGALDLRSSPDQGCHATPRIPLH
ncbi:PAS domain S-box protein [Planctomycetota bacterium]